MTVLTRDLFWLQLRGAIIYTMCREDFVCRTHCNFNNYRIVWDKKEQRKQKNQPGLLLKGWSDMNLKIYVTIWNGNKILCHSLSIILQKKSIYLSFPPKLLLSWINVCQKHKKQKTKKLSHSLLFGSSKILVKMFFSPNPSLSGRLLMTVN